MTKDVAAASRQPRKTVYPIWLVRVAMDLDLTVSDQLAKSRTSRIQYDKIDQYTGKLRTLNTRSRLFIFLM